MLQIKTELGGGGGGGVISGLHVSVITGIREAAAGDTSGKAPRSFRDGLVDTLGARD